MARAAKSSIFAVPEAHLAAVVEFSDDAIFSTNLDGMRVLQDGAEAVQALLPPDGSSPPPPRMIPVVVLTSSAEDKDLMECYALGANSYIVKPVDFQEFTDAARSVGLYWTLLNQVPRESSG